MNLLYLVFGPNVKNHFQATFSILTFLRQGGGRLASITVLTDAPAYYSHLAGHVTVVPLAEQTLAEWKGEFNFFWRVKIKALEYLAQQHPNSPLLYLDSDTFLYGSLAEFGARPSCTSRKAPWRPCRAKPSGACGSRFGSRPSAACPLPSSR